MPRKKVEIFTDGACSGNPGPGGWGALLRYGSSEKELSGGAAETDQQPHGAERGDRCSGSTEGAL